MYACDTNDLNNIYLLMYTYLYLRDFKEADQFLAKICRDHEATGEKN